MEKNRSVVLADFPVIFLSEESLYCESQSTRLTFSVCTHNSETADSYIISYYAISNYTIYWTDSDRDKPGNESQCLFKEINKCLLSPSMWIELTKFHTFNT